MKRQDLDSANALNRAEPVNQLGDRLIFLEKRCQQLTTIINTVPQIVWAASAEGQFLYVNSQWCEQTHLTLEDFSREGFFRAIHPDDHNRIMAEWRDTLRRKTPYQAVVRLRQARDQYQWCDLQAYPLHSPHHRSNEDQSQVAQAQVAQVAWVGTLSSAQRLKDAQVSLLEEQNFLKSILTHLSDGIVACDANGILTLLNRAAEEFHHLPQQSLPAQEWSARYHLYQADGKTPMGTEDVPLYRALKGESVRDMEMHIVPKQGEPRIVLVSGDAIVGAEGQTLGAVVAMKDITQRKQAEAALRSLNADLEARVQERTLELEQSCQELKREMDARKNIEQRLVAQNQLLLQQNRKLKRQRQQIQQQNIQLTEASRMKSRFLATMSHELRTPMNAIIGFSQLLLRQRKNPLSPQMEEMVKRILNNGKKLLGLVNELLDFSKAEAGKLDLNPQRFDLNQLLTSTLDELRSLADPKKLTLQLDVQLSHPHVMNDPGRLRQVFVNLLSNAIKFTEKGHVLISVYESCSLYGSSSSSMQNLIDDWDSVGSIARTNPDRSIPDILRDKMGDRLVITVEDTGIGMDPATIDTIFEPFCQLDQSHTRKYGGTGLGLAIVDSIIQLMDGNIAVESQLGQGSRFQIEIPRWIGIDNAQEG